MPKSTDRSEIKDDSRYKVMIEGRYLKQVYDLAETLEVTRPKAVEWLIQNYVPIAIKDIEASRFVPGKSLMDDSGNTEDVQPVTTKSSLVDSTEIETKDTAAGTSPTPIESPTATPFGGVHKATPSGDDLLNSLVAI